MTQTPQDPADSSGRLRQVGFALLVALALPAFGFAEETADSIPPESMAAEAASIPAPVRAPGPGQAPPEAAPAAASVSFTPTIEMASLPAVESPDYDMDEEGGVLGAVAGGIGSVGRTILPWIGGGRQSAGLGPSMLIETVTGEDADTAETLSLVDAQGF